jgi:hypothetical protein
MMSTSVVVWSGVLFSASPRLDARDRSMDLRGEWLWEVHDAWSARGDGFEQAERLSAQGG